MAAAAIILGVFGCATSRDARRESPEKKSLLVPIGRLLESGNSVGLYVDGAPYSAEIIRDGSGGAWYQVPESALRDKKRLEVKIGKSKPKSNVRETDVDPKRWIAPCDRIDSDAPPIVLKAAEISKGSTSNDEKARKILEFVSHEIAFKLYPGMHNSNASLTLAAGFGICVNHARLFVGLCRAAGVPARTISGAVVEKDASYHHEWAEFLDDSGMWHMVEPTSPTPFEFGDVRYLDMIYDIEANPFYPFGRGWEIDKVVLEDGRVAVFCPNWDLQKATGKMDFQSVMGDTTEAMSVTIAFNPAKYLGE